MDDAPIEHLTETTREKLRQTVAKIERLEEEKKEVAEQIKEVYAEAKAIGFDTKALRQGDPPTESRQGGAGRAGNDARNLSHCAGRSLSPFAFASGNSLGSFHGPGSR